MKNRASRFTLNEIANRCFQLYKYYKDKHNCYNADAHHKNRLKNGNFCIPQEVIKPHSRPCCVKQNLEICIVKTVQ